MSFEAAFLSLMPHTVTVQELTGKNADGSPTYSTSAVSYRARVVRANKQVRDGRGNTVMAGYFVWVASTGTLSPQALYTLPDGSQPPVFMVESFPDEDGTHHHKVVFGTNRVSLV